MNYFVAASVWYSYGVLDLVGFVSLCNSQHCTLAGDSGRSLYTDFAKSMSIYPALTWYESN